jgi:cbb3-type cytochrome oxidase maturation protein
MASLYLLIPIALLFCALAIRLLLWAIDSGQYDDLDKEAWRVLLDDDDVPPSNRGPGTYGAPQEQRPPSP